MIETLNDLQPVFIIGLMMVFWLIELLFPFLTPPFNRLRHAGRNLLTMLFAMIANIGMSLIALQVIGFAAENNIGLLHWVHLPPVAEVIIGMLLYDLGSYTIHHFQHKVPFMWLAHRVHHSELSLNVTSTFRFHPLDIIYSNGLQLITILVFGISQATYIIYFTVLLPIFIAEHSNITLPKWLDNILSLVIVTPNWHKVHHSNHQPETDSHYADMFALWDRVFGSGQEADINTIRYGLKEFEDDSRQTVGSLLKTGFKK